MIFRFDDFELDTGAYALRRGDTPIATEPQVFDLLLFLVENRERVVSKDELFENIWSGRIVSDATLASRLSAARTALGDTGKAQRYIKTFPRRGFRFVGATQVVDGKSPASRHGPGAIELTTRKDVPELPLDATHAKIAAQKPPQEIRFCRTTDNFQLAFSQAGEGPALVKAANWMNHLEFEYDNPPWNHWWEALSQSNTLIRYDQRTNGLSDQGVDDLSFATMVDDLEVLVDSIGLEKFSLLGVSQGSALSIAYAVRHPERVERLVLYGGYIKGWRRRGTAEEIARGEAMTTLIRDGWGQDNPAFRQMFTSMFMPMCTSEQMLALNELQRQSVSPENAARLHEMFGDFDVSDLVSQVRVPTLVLHTIDDARAPFEEGRNLAAGIPGARFVPLEGKNHILLPQDPSWSKFLDEVMQFLGVGK